jgi:hypothetical protein
LEEDMFSENWHKNLKYTKHIHLKNNEGLDHYVVEKSASGFEK